MKQSRFKEIVSEELALSRVGLREAAGPSKHSNVITVFGQALTSLTAAMHEVGDVARRLAPFDKERASTIDGAYDAIFEQVKLLRTTLHAAQSKLTDE